MRPSRSWLYNGLLIIASLGVTVLLAEVAVRIVLPQPTGLTHQDRYGLPLHYPGITRYLPQYGHSVTFNSVGMRDGEHSLAKPADTYRILLLGDSFMEAVQVPFDSSFARRLESDLARLTGRKIEVINAGVGGWGQDDELRYLSSYGMAYHADLVLVAMTLHNDISDNLRRTWYTVRDSALVAQPLYPMSFLRYKVVQVKAWLSTRFQLYQLWRRVRHGNEIRQVGQQLTSFVSQLFQNPTPPRVAQGYDVTDHMLASIRDSARAGSARMAMVLLPIRYQLSDSLFSEFAELNKVPLQQMDIGKPQAIVQRMGDSLGVPVIDLLPSFRQWNADSSASLYMVWDGHWDKPGHQLAASVTAQGLVSAGLLQAASAGPVAQRPASDQPPSSTDSAARH